ncbi:helix-turn-helix transcriptional regulator [Pseudonocardiaceae bacterium YIM PH 21723]|nr:helix-turn-helix transcriptional regulator [Pseudonocardiaceae bacterium YIM PH 21723]
MLEHLGFDPTAESVYRLLLTRRDLSTEDIAGLLGISAEDACSAIQHLVDLTLLRASVANPGELRPVHPDLAAELLLERQRAVLLRQQQAFAESQLASARLAAEYARLSLDAEPYQVETLQGIDAIQSRLEHLARNVERECLSLMPGGAQSARSLAASRPLDESMLSRGVAVLTVYLDSVRNDPATWEYSHWLSAMGGEVRTVPVLPLRMVMFDRDTVMVPLDPDNTRRGAVLLHGSGFVTAMGALFDQVWSAATPIAELIPRPRDARITAQERELLCLLTTGATDEVAARKLGLSVRTVRRMMADLTDRLGARSRFETGVRAAQQGWLNCDC